MSVVIPSFVMRGIATMNGGTFEDVQYRTEADLRDAMAATWWLHGANVRTEVKVPDCGRIDILVEAAQSVLVIEMKKSISTPTEARLAFQQCNTYVRYLEAEDFDRRRDSGSQEYQRISGVVTAGSLDFEACRRASRAFGDVMDWTYLEVVGMASEAKFRAFGPGDPDAADVMATASRTRRKSLRHLLDLSSVATSSLCRAVEARSLSDMEVA